MLIDIDNSSISIKLVVMWGTSRMELKVMKMAMAACTSLRLDLPPRSVLLDYRQAVDKITLQLRRYKQTMCYNCLLVKNIFSFSI